jgi:non-lysosomal glucosylceramidase
MNNNQSRSNIPAATWQRPIGLGWDQPYTVRYASNLDDGPWHGSPLGGFGAGSVGRSPRGDFNLWHIDAGEHLFRPIPACQFSVFEQLETGEAKALAMGCHSPQDSSLSRWQWYPVSDEQNSTGTYHALYPRSWFLYENVFKTQITCEQLSPIWGNNYQESSYPLAVFTWSVHNPTDQPITISIMLTWQNIVGWFTNVLKTPEVTVRDDGSPVYEYQPRIGDSTGSFNQYIVDFHRVGCILDRVRLGEEISAGEGQWAIATVTNPSLETFYHSRWNPTGDGSEIWDTFACDGSLSDYENETAADPGEQIACAIAVRFTVRPGKTKQIPFVIAWDFPVMEFAQGVQYFRRYTDFFGRSGNNVWSMIRTGLKHDDMWRENIQIWQDKILNDSQLPSWLKMALFNELYDLSSGGSIWTAASEDDPIGQFGVLECLDYRWYESLDVRLYGGFALAMLWPKLDKSILEAYCRAISTSDNTPRIIGYNQALGVRKIAGATPHDLGAPNEHPWQKTNYTSYQDCNLWKDLGCDFVLQVYRYFLFNGSQDFEFLKDSWLPMITTLAYVKKFDLDGDTIPENSGAPDQTFDDWKLQGVSAYCGGLWLASLSAAIAIGQALLTNEWLEHTWSHYAEISPTIATYQTWLETGKKVYQEKLWNGEYYRLDSDSGSQIVMADQLCGEYIVQILELPSIVPPECTKIALETIYQACFLNFYHGKFGLANGVNPDGKPENPQATHPLEIWTGINFAIAAFMIKMGMKEQGLKIAETVVKQIYENGLQFRTPEAITTVGTFRASHYLRAMAIWAIYREL